MRPGEIPQELVSLLDHAAGKRHSRTGSVMTTLAEILTRFEERLAVSSYAKAIAVLERTLASVESEPYANAAGQRNKVLGIKLCLARLRIAEGQELEQPEQVAG